MCGNVWPGFRQSSFSAPGCPVMPVSCPQGEGWCPDICSCGQTQKTLAQAQLITAIAPEHQPQRDYLLKPIHIHRLHIFGFVIDRLMFENKEKNRTQPKQQLLESLYWALCASNPLQKKQKTKKHWLKHLFCPLTCNVRIASYKKEKTTALYY